jgi:hypothetical protein
MAKIPKFSISLSFEEVKLPPFQDILLLGRKCPHGKVGVSQCLNLLAPEAFEMVEINDPTVEAMLISKRLLKRMPAENIVEILKEKVFPYITPGEVVKIDFNVRIYFDNLEGTLKKKT